MSLGYSHNSINEAAITFALLVVAGDNAFWDAMMANLQTAVQCLLSKRH